MPSTMLHRVPTQAPGTSLPSLPHNHQQPDGKLFNTAAICSGSTRAHLERLLEEFGSAPLERFQSQPWRWKTVMQRFATGGGRWQPHSHGMSSFHPTYHSSSSQLSKVHSSGTPTAGAASDTVTIHPGAGDTQPTPLLFAVTAPPAAPQEAEDWRSRLGGVTVTAITFRVEAGSAPRCAHQAGPVPAGAKGVAAGQPTLPVLPAVPVSWLCPSDRNVGVSHGPWDRSHPHTGQQRSAGSRGGRSSGQHCQLPQSSRARSPELQNSTALLGHHPSHQAPTGTVSEARPGPGRRRRAAAAAVQEPCDSRELAAPQIPAGSSSPGVPAPPFRLPALVLSPGISIMPGAQGQAAPARASFRTGTPKPGHRASLGPCPAGPGRAAPPPALPVPALSALREAGSGSAPVPGRVRCEPGRPTRAAQTDPAPHRGADLQ